ncbi:MAG: Hpt domain-containing protein [Gemmatimonadaceae bacterium]|nr:Hpt domain-containing protein [Gemmatimonadaceae bacterium]
MGTTTPHPILDTDILRRYIGEDEEIVREFLVGYRESAVTYHQKLMQAYLGKDYQTLANAAHSFKSSSRAVGALALGELCSEVESAAKRHDATALDAYCPLFSQELARVEQRLDELLAPAP